MKIQKPGQDFYGSTTCFLALLVIYVFSFWKVITVDQTELLDAAKGNSNLFKGDMAIMVLIVLTIMIIERYVNRCDTKAVDNKSLIDDADDKNFFSKKEKGLQRLSTKSMTMKL